MKLHLSFVFALAGFTAITSTRAAEAKADPNLPVSYYKQIRPIFQANCQGCHQPAKSKGGYVMTDFAKLLAGGDSKDKAIVAKQPEKSNLLKVITPVKGEAEMPEGKPPLVEGEIELIKNWIAQGALDDTPENAKRRFSPQNPPVYTRSPVLTSLDYSPDGSLIAVAGFHEVLLHKADGSGLVARLIGLSERIESARFSPDGKFLAVTGGQPARMGEVQVWDVETRKLALSVPVTYDTVYGASWSPDGTAIAFGCGDNSVRAINAKTGEQIFFMGSHSDWVFDTAFNLTGEHLISAGRDMTAKLTEFKTQRFIDNITSITPGALKGGIGALARHPDRDEVLMGGSDGEPQIFRVFRTTKRVIGDNANLIKKFPAMPGRVFSVGYSRDGNRFAAGSSFDGRGEVVVYGAIMSKMPTNIVAMQKKPLAQQTAEEKTAIAKFQSENAQLIAKVAVTNSGIYAIAFNPDGKTVAAGGSDGKIRLINAETGEVTKEFTPVTLVAKTAANAANLAPFTDTTLKLDPETLPKDAKVTAIEVLPTAITLTGRNDYSQLLVTAKLASGDTVDISRMAQFSLSAKNADVSVNGLVRPLKDGAAQLEISFSGKTITVPVTVSSTAIESAADFVRDVNPILSKLGCNQGTCHGSKDGRNGFKLSLRGYDPIYDVRAFTDDLASRRVNLASPDDSLMLLKATGAVPHMGGQLMKPGDKYYSIVHNWIANGAKLDLTTPRVTSIEIFPKNPVVQQIGSKQQIRAIASYADGRKRDVSAEAFFESGNMDIIKTENGIVTVLRRGEAPVLVRFEGAYAATTITAMGDRTGFVWKQPPSNGKIDELVAAKWQRMKILPADLCSEDEFLRRAYLDLTGLPPTADEVRAFLADTRESRAKRDAIIDKLVGSETYIEHWANKWADLLQVNSKFLGTEGAVAFRKWIRDEVAQNTPYDQFAKKILTATGSNKEQPQAAYYKILRTPADTMENTTHLFLATRFNCNKCHDHPFERWTQDQYYETAAFFAQVGLKTDPASGNKKIGGTAVEGAKPLYEIVEDLKSGDVKHDRTGQITAPIFPFAAKHETKVDASRRDRLAAWIISPDNQYFARSYVNRIWGYLLGVGIIEPIDDIRAGNPPTNPELLDLLTQEFIQSGFNVQNLIKNICKSRTYQLSIKSSKWNDDDKINYSHATARRLPAEVLFDSIYFATGASSQIPGVAPGTRAAALADAAIKLPDGFLNNLGRPARESACECERGSGLQLGPVMALVSGPTVDTAISDPQNAIAKFVAAQADNEKLINELFLRILNRPATPIEIKKGLTAIAAIEPEHQQVVTDLAALEKTFAPIIAQKEGVRQATIKEAQAHLDAYQKEIAPREADLDRQQKERLAAAEAALKSYDSTITNKLAAWEAKLDKDTGWTALDPKELKSSFNAKLEKQKDLSIFASGPNGKGTYDITAETDLTGITAIKLEALTDARLGNNGPGRSPTGNFVLTELTLKAAPKGKPAEAKTVDLQNAKADFSQEKFDVKSAIDGQATPNNGWAIDPKTGASHMATLEFKQPLSIAGGATLSFSLNQQYTDSMHTLGRFRLSVTTAKTPVSFGTPSAIADILAIASDKRDEKQKSTLLSHFRESDSELKKLQLALSDAKKPRAADPKIGVLQATITRVSEPLPIDPKLRDMRRSSELSTKQLGNQRLVAAQDLAWALINSPAFLFNR